MTELKVLAELAAAMFFILAAIFGFFVLFHVEKPRHLLTGMVCVVVGGSLGIFAFISGVKSILTN